jgi:hypothetical protein
MCNAVHALHGVLQYYVLMKRVVQFVSAGLEDVVMKLVV